MATYNTVPTEKARLNEPKAPQNRKALIALVAAVCFASACAGAVAPSAVRGLSSLAADPAPAPAAPVSPGKITLTDPVATKTDWNLCKSDWEPVFVEPDDFLKEEKKVWECPNLYTEDGKAVACKEGEYCEESDNMKCPLGSSIDSMGAEADKAGCSREELDAARDKIDDLFSDHPYGAHNNICYQKKKKLGTCTKIEIKGTCGTTEVITASMQC